MSKIDVHHHFYAPVFTEAFQRAGGGPSGWNVPSWTLEADKTLNKTLAQLARQVNEYAAEIRDAEPTSYGFFASLPSLLNTDLAILELAHSLDTLHADGVILFTRYGTDNHYLGHPVFLSIWAELNRREAVVFIHPTHAVDTNLVNSHLPQPMFDYPHETGRTAIDLVLSDTLRTVAPDCKIILSHAGGTLPYLIYRPTGMLPYTPFSVNKSTEEIVEQARTFYFDTAISANPLTLGLLFKFAKKNHVQFGSDFPNAPMAGIEGFTKQLDEFDLTEEQRRGVEWEAAAELSPSLRQN